MGNHKRRLERLEGGREEGIILIFVDPGETAEEVLQQHLAAHPEDEARMKLILDLSGAGQDPPSASPPPRPKPQEIAKAPGPAPLMITD